MGLHNICPTKTSRLLGFLNNSIPSPDYATPVRKFINPMHTIINTFIHRFLILKAKED